MNPALKLVLLSPWSPFRLFNSGESGFWFDPSDLSTMFQDSAGTTPVTAAGQSIGKILDKSGRGNHATQATAGSRPVLQQDSAGRYYISFNGTTSCLSIPDSSGLRQSLMAFFAGFNPTSSVATRQDLLANGNAAAFTSNNHIIGFGSTASKLDVLGRTPASVLVGPSILVNQKTVFSVVADGTNITQRMNGGNSVASAGTLGTDNTSGITIGGSVSNGTLGQLFNGAMYQLIARAAATNATQVLQGERWVNGKTGAY